MQQQTPEALDLAGMAADLNSLLRLKTTVIGIKMFARVEEMTAIAGQKPVVTKAKKAISNFKLREKMPIGVMVTKKSRPRTSGFMTL